jgi:hypothetical protein
MALNAHVVFSDQAPNFLKWDVIGSILADETSGPILHTEVDIICGGGDYGRCYKMYLDFCHTYIDPDTYVLSKWSGKTNDVCYESQEYDDCGGYGDNH